MNDTLRSRHRRVAGLVTAVALLALTAGPAFAATWHPSAAVIHRALLADGVNVDVAELEQVDAVDTQTTTPTGQNCDVQDPPGDQNNEVDQQGDVQDPAGDAQDQNCDVQDQTDNVDQGQQGDVQDQSGDQTDQQGDVQDQTDNVNQGQQGDVQDQSGDQTDQHGGSGESGNSGD